MAPSSFTSQVDGTFHHATPFRKNNRQGGMLSSLFFGLWIGVTLALLPLTSWGDFFTGITHLEVHDSHPQQLRININADSPLTYQLTTPDINTIELTLPQARLSLDLLQANGQLNIPANGAFQKAFWTPEHNGQAATLRLMGPRLSQKRVIILGASPQQASKISTSELSSTHNSATNDATKNETTRGHTSFISAPASPSVGTLSNKPVYSAVSAHTPPHSSSSLITSTTPPEPFSPELSPHKALFQSHTSTAFSPPEPSIQPELSPTRHPMAPTYFAEKPINTIATATPLAPNTSINSGVQRALHLVEENKPEQALSILTQLIKQHPKTPTLQATLGELYLNTNHPQLAFIAFKQALLQEDTPFTQAIYLDRCSAALYQSNAVFASINQLTELTKQYPQLAMRQFLTQLTLGTLLIKTGSPESALIHLQQASQLNPTSPEAHYYLGLTYELQNQNKSAQQHYERAHTLSPQFPGVKQALLRLDKRHSA